MKLAVNFAKIAFNLERIANALDKLSRTEIITFEQATPETTARLHRIEVSEDSLEQIAEEEQQELNTKVKEKLAKIKAEDMPFWEEDTLTYDELEARR